MTKLQELLRERRVKKDLLLSLRERNDSYVRLYIDDVFFPIQKDKINLMLYNEIAELTNKIRKEKTKR